MIDQAPVSRIGCILNRLPGFQGNPFLLILRQVCFSHFVHQRHHQDVFFGRCSHEIMHLIQHLGDDELRRMNAEFLPVTQTFKHLVKLYPNRVQPADIVLCVAKGIF